MGGATEDATIEARLREVGLQPTLPLDLGATIRGDAATIGASEGTDSTAHPSAEPVESPTSTLPRLSIDLGLAADAPALPAGADLEVRGVIGEGGMGKVLLARQRSLSREVAVKTTKDGAPPEAARAILVEGATCGRLEHPSIVPVHALGLDEAGRPALIMKRIEGVGWDALLDDPTHPGWEGWDGEPADRLPGHLQILGSICNAVHFAHSRGVVHRDIKPENVLIGRFGDVYLADWGIATEHGAAEPGRLCGTPGYLAPEMVDGRPVDARTDVYLLGATLHQILTGRRRHDAETAIQALGMALFSAPHDYGPDVPAELATLANRACHARPEERPPSAKAFRDALTRYAKLRDSAALAEEATERLVALERLLADGAESEEAKREADRLAAEARFGLSQAVELGPENADAAAALARLEALLGEGHRRAAELERQARERDPRIGARARAIALTVFAIAGGGISVTALAGPIELGPTHLVAFPLSMLVLLAVGVLVLRKRILENAFNRQLAAAVALIITIMIAGRALGLVTDVSVAEHFARDGFVMGVSFAVLGVTHLRWLRALGALMVAVGAACTVWPAHAAFFFGVATAGAMAVGAAFAWRATLRR